MQLIDKFGRKITYLRISVTDRCNLRCIYCMPEKGIELLPHREILTYEEILRIIFISNKIGINKFRITGGEPLVRKGLIDFLKEATKTKCDFSITTNGTLLLDYAEDIFRAGIKRINISLDTLNEKKFNEITCTRNKLERVVNGIKKCIKLGFSPIKINVVLIDGINTDELDDFVMFAYKKPVVVRFIERIPVEKLSNSKIDTVAESEIVTLPKISISDNSKIKGFLNYETSANATGNIEETLAKKYDLKKVSVPGAGPGTHYKFKNKSGKGYIGFILSMSKPFCSICNRLRLTADGKLKLCLGHPYEINLKKFLRNGATDEEIKNLFKKAAENKPGKHNFGSLKECMSKIGG